MAIHNPAQAYRSNQVTTATQGDLTFMLYNGAIKFIKQAKQEIEANNLQYAHNHIVRVQDILKELILTLNPKVEISEQFLTMYDYMMNRMIEANVNKDKAILDEVESFFIEFRDVWKEVMMITKQQGQKQA
ncbi:flagellar export chaperone FliS [Aneurinibacillus sp. REN35]|uniref:flagellar export chaperone FliS n=1 Tax=Aneurinibacillus sp. REN35 TaxID=3237286 RepID=UPI003529D2C5